MAINDRNIIIRISNDSKKLEDNKILTEAYENCNIINLNHLFIQL